MLGTNTGSQGAPARPFSQETLLRALQDKRITDAASKLGFDLGDNSQLNALLNKAGVSVSSQPRLVQSLETPPVQELAPKITARARDALRHYRVVASFEEARFENE